MAPTLMIQGTAGGVGKTTVARALTRLFEAGGLSVARGRGIGRPFSKNGGKADIVIIEGTGNPADDPDPADNANMLAAAMAGAGVLLVADASRRGGLAAEICGTLFLLSDRDRARVKGLVLNRIPDSADARSIGSRLEQLTGLPVVAAIPILEDPESLRESPPLEAVVLELPLAAGRADAEALAAHSAFAVREAFEPADLGEPDLLILPDCGDADVACAFLFHSGLERSVVALAKTGMPVVGLGAGARLLAEFSLVPPFAEKRDRFQRSVVGRVNPLTGIFSCLSGLEFTGDGVLAAADVRRAFATVGAAAGEIPEGAVQGNVLATGVTGVFASPTAVGRLAEELLRRKGVDDRPPRAGVIEEFFDRKKLQEIVRL